MHTKLAPQPLMNQNRISAIFILANCNPSLLEFIFHHKKTKLRHSTIHLLDESREFDLEDQLIIRVAIDFWNRTARTDLAQMLAHWDPFVWVRFIQAIAHLKEIRQEVIEKLQEDEERGFPLSSKD
jgi:hypothetical protein